MSPDTAHPSDSPAGDGTSGGPFGQRVLRKEDARLLTGHGRFIGDVRLPNMVHVAFVRSPLAHARIVDVDVSEALALDGVVAVATGADADFAAMSLTAESALPTHTATPQRPLASGKVRFQGEAVAAVVATDRYVAEDAAELVVVDYEELTVHVDAVRAYGATEDLVHDDAVGNVLVSSRKRSTCRGSRAAAVGSGRHGRGCCR